MKVCVCLWVLGTQQHQAVLPTTGKFSGCLRKALGFHHLWIYLTPHLSSVRMLRFQVPTKHLQTPRPCSQKTSTVWVCLQIHVVSHQKFKIRHKLVWLYCFIPEDDKDKPRPFHCPGTEVVHPAFISSAWRIRPHVSEQPAFVMRLFDICQQKSNRNGRSASCHMSSHPDGAADDDDDVDGIL